MLREEAALAKIWNEETPESLIREEIGKAVSR